MRKEEQNLLKMINKVKGGEKPAASAASSSAPATASSTSSRKRKPTTVASKEPTRELKGSALIIEPDKRLSLMFSNLANALKYEPIVTSYGEDALVKAAEKTPSFIILEKALADVDGYNCCSKLRTVPGMTEDIPIILIADPKEGADENGALMVGASEFMEKPLNATKLKEIIKKVTAE